MDRASRFRLIAASAIVGVLAEVAGLPVGACVALVVTCQIVMVGLRMWRSPG